MEENLNIDYHVKQLILMALNCSNTLPIAAEKLKVSPKTLFNYINQYELNEQYARWKTHVNPKKT
jgi:predicted transcriptional regulator YheO